jgi:hypothetical protein
LRVLAVAMTCAPSRRANWTAKWPTPPAAAVISTRWPVVTFAVSTSACQAVSAASGTAAASSHVTDTGLRANCRAGAVTYSL